VAASAPPKPKHPGRPGRLLILTVLIVVAVVLPAGAALLDRRQPAPTRLAPGTQPVPSVQTYPPGRPAPTLRLETLDGGRLDLAALRGRPLVVNFWATWCEPCVREFPLLRRAAADHRGDRLAVVGVLTNDRPDPARAFARRHGATWPMALDPAASTAATWGAVGLPHTFFVHSDGTLSTHQLGELTRASLDRQLRRLLG
jgi:peroxiredoxin